MRAIAEFAMRSPMAASVSAAAYAVIALFFAPFVVVSAAIIALATLRSGAGRGIQVFASALLLAGSIYYFFLAQASLILVLGITWVPMIVAAQVLRLTERQGTALTVCAIAAAFYAILVRLLVPDVEALWLARLQNVGESVRAQGGTFFRAEELTIIAGVMHEAIIVVACLYWIAAVLLARWWQAALYNPGGFGSEFRRLAVPRVVSPVAAVVAVMASIQLLGGDRDTASDLLIVLVVLFAFQGIALLHHRAHRVGLARGWLVGFYVLLFLMPHRMAILLAFAGIADTVVDIRGLRRMDGPAE